MGPRVRTVERYNVGSITDQDKLTLSAACLRKARSYSIQPLPGISRFAFATINTKSRGRVFRGPF